MFEVILSFEGAGLYVGYSATDITRNALICRRPSVRPPFWLAQMLLAVDDNGPSFGLTPGCFGLGFDRPRRPVDSLPGRGVMLYGGGRTSLSVVAWEFSTPRK